MKKPKVIVRKDWPSKDALKKAIRKHLDKGPADELEICDALGIDLRTACEAMDELVAEGKIAPVRGEKK